MNSSTRSASDQVCLGCGCLCDDPVLESSGGTAVVPNLDCSKGREWFAAAARPLGPARAWIDGVPATIAEAERAACDRLFASRSTLIVPDSVSMESAAAIAALADRVRGCVEPAALRTRACELAAFQRVGAVSSTLGEIRDRGELVIVWGADLDRDLPRFRERFLSDRDLPGRTVLELPCERLPHDEAAFFAAWRAALAGKAVDRPRMLLAAGTFASDLDEWSRRIRAVAHTVLLVAERPERDRSAWSQILGWIRDRARVSRCTGLVLGGSANSAGIGAALTWNAGAPSGIDLRLGHPRHLPGSIERGAARGEFDLILRIAGRASSVDDLDYGNSSMRRIEIGPDAGSRVVPGDGVVQIECAEFGVDEGGTIARMDGVLLPVRPWRDTDRPRVVELLRNWVGRFDEDFSA